MARNDRVTRRSLREHPSLLSSLLEGAGEVVQTVVNEVAPGVVGALDVDAVVQRVDIQAVLDRIDVEELVERIDLNALMEKVDIDLLLSRMDVDRLLARIDIQALVKRVDLDEIIDQVDMNALLERVDVNAIVERTELAEIVTRSGAGIAVKVLDQARSLGVGADSFVHRWVDRLLRRDPASLPPGPMAIIDPAPAPTR